MKISIRNLWSLVCTLALLGTQILPAYTWADTVSTASMQPIVPVVAIGKVTYLLGQAEVTNADGSVSPLAVQMEIPDGSRIHVKKRSRLNLLMVDGGSEKLGPDTVFTFNKYTYDPNDPQATEIRKTLQDGEVTSTTGRGGDVAKERYRLNSPLAAIGVLGTEYTVKVSKGETWVTVHSGELSIAKLGGSCQRSGLGACAGGERLSEGQRGLALVVRANEPKPVLMPATAIPASETKAETPPPPVQEAEKASVKEPEKAEKSEQTAATEKVISEKPTEPEAQKSSPEPLPLASASQPDTAKQPEHTSSTAATIAAPPLVSPAPVVEQPPVVEKASVAVAATDAGHSLGATFVLESADASFTANTASATPSPETPVVSHTPVVSNTKAKQSLVQSSNSASTAPVSAKVSAVPAVTTTEPVVTTKSTVESAPTKPAVTTVTIATPVVVTPVVAPPVTEKPAVETVVVTPEKPTTAVVTATPVIASELSMPTVNWGKFDPVATIDGKTSFGEQVDSSYTQLLQPVNATASNPVVLQQNPSVSLPEPDKKAEVGVASDHVAAPTAAPVAVATPVAITVSNTDVSKTVLRDDSAILQTPVVTSPVIAVPLTAAPSLTATAVLDRTSDSPLTPVTPLTLTPPLVSP